MRFSWTLLLTGLLSWPLDLQTSAAADQRPVDFERQVRPLLVKHCGNCHGPRQRLGGLRLDIRQTAFSGGDSGPVIKAGSSDQSELLRRITSRDAGEQMPPEGDRLTAEEVRLLRRWIDDGAHWVETDYDRAGLVDSRLEHWAFQPLDLTPPTGGAADKPMGSVIDRFISEQLKEHELSLQRSADRRTLIRRLSFDLLGLPPTPDEVRQFLSDDRPDATRLLIDRLLANPRYGERWGQHWLDVVRYADTHGFEVNTPRAHAWPYRDYVISSLNQDKPYDEFVREQLAGDQLEADPATGFLVAAAVLLPGQIGKDEESKRLARQDALDEIIVGTSATFLGLTVGCARCHDHKFDPITQRDYYSMQAFFSGVEYGDRPLKDAEYHRRHAQLNELSQQIRQLDRQLQQTPRPLLQVAPAPPPLPESPQRRSIDQTALELQRQRLQKRSEQLKTDRLVYAGVFRKPHPTHLLRRGDPEQPVEPVDPAWPALFAASPGKVQTGKVQPGQNDAGSSLSDAERRLALADWISAPENPLTARVMVNRLWAGHFGRGLVETPSDFGLNGARPTHPGLLDWLAAEFIRSGWSIKHIHRLILNSATYQQASQIDDRGRQTDRGNQLLWRFPARRLEAEAIRDTMLMVSGELNQSMGGPGFDFFRSRGGLNGFPPIDKFPSEGLKRMIYAHKIRMERVPIFGAFDCPDAGQPTPIRSRSTTAIQALNLFNSQFVIDRAEQFARRVERDSGPGVEQQVEQAFQLAYSRPPTSIERQAALQTANAHGLPVLCRVLFNTNEFLFLP